MKTILISILAGAAAFLTASPSVAQQAGSSAAVVVSYADLDLGTRSGVRTLDRRIRSAVEQACGPISSFDPAGKNHVLQCRTEALALARAQRDSAIAEATVPGIRLAAQR